MRRRAGCARSLGGLGCTTVNIDLVGEKVANEAGIKVVSLHASGSDWVTNGATEATALFFGEPKRPDSPVAVFTRAGRDVGDRIAGVRTHDTPVMNVVVAGTAQIDGRWLREGDIQVVEAGAAHGDLVVGPDGATVMSLFAQRSGLIPSFADPGDQAAFDDTLRPAVEAAARGESEAPFALLPPRLEHAPRRGIKVLDLEPVAADTPIPDETPPGHMYTHLTDESLPWGPPVLNARTALIVLGDAADPAAPTIGVIDVKPGPGDRLRGRHLHHSDAINLVLRGSLYMDGVWLRAGEAKIVERDLVYGDGLAGPDGVNFLEIWSRQDGAGPIFDDPDDQNYFDKLRAQGHLAERRSL